MKKIKVNPAFFKLSKKKKEKKKKPQNTTLKVNSVKTALMNRIKEHQKARSQKAGSSIINEPLVNNFESTMKYLEKVSTDKNIKNTQKTNSSKSNNTHKTNSLKSKDRPPPPYGLLKGGNKPLFSQYNKTLKNKIQFQEENPMKLEIKEKDQTNVKHRKQKLEEIKRKFQGGGKKKKRRFIRRTLGKRNKKVGILINCKKSRKKIGKFCNTLRKKSIPEMKRKLRKKGLLKIGSQAPDDIVKTIFTNSQMAGEIENKNGDVLVYNYMKDAL